MRKLKLTVENLQVSSFDTAPTLAGRGTVDAASNPVHTRLAPTCDGRDTCDPNLTCGYDCATANNTACYGC